MLTSVKLPWGGAGAAGRSCQGPLRRCVAGDPVGPFPGCFEDPTSPTASNHRAGTSMRAIRSSTYINKLRICDRRPQLFASCGIFRGIDHLCMVTISLRLLKPLELPEAAYNTLSLVVVGICDAKWQNDTAIAAVPRRKELLEISPLMLFN